MWWTFEKLAARINELAGLRYRDERSIPQFACIEDREGAVGVAPPEAEAPWRTMRLGETWKGRDYYLWLSVQVQAPREWGGKVIVGLFDFGRTGGGNNSGFESLLYVDGVPYQGVDSNHQEVRLPADCAGTPMLLQFRLWSGLNGYGAPADIEHRLQAAKLCWLDETADDLFYTAKAMLETIQTFDANRPEREQLLGLLDRAFGRIDWSQERSADFYASLAEALQMLNEGLEQIGKHHAVQVDCIGHTHIDVAWLWRIRHTREKAARSFSTVLRLMEQYPDYLFLQTQPQLYEYMKQDYPELYERIRERVKEGRWEAGGAMWLEADCNLPSGESLVRQILYGTMFLRDEFGVECTYLWLPDVFGYSWALPQILRKSGIEAFMTTKISWNQYNRMPHDTFKWRGIDGTDIVAHFITTPSNGQDEESFLYTYNGEVTPHSVQGIWNGYRDKGLNRDLLLAFGYGDGGGGPTRSMLEMRRRIDRMPGMPRVRPGRADDYFTRLVQRVSEHDGYVHVWDGEMYLETHRGTYTSQAYNKLMNRRLELLYREAEWICSLHSVSRSDWSTYPAEDLLVGWKIVLRNQFHDIIPGSSIREVYEDSREEYEQAKRLGEAVRTGAAQGLALLPASTAGNVPHGYSYTVFNSASWERDDLVLIPAERSMEQGEWRGADGAALSAQLTEDGWLVAMPGLPSMGVASLTFQPIFGGEAPSGTSGSQFVYAEGLLETPMYRIRWNERGTLTEIYDKREERSVLAPGACGNELQVFEDKPKGRHEAWDIDIFYSQKMRTVGELLSAELIESGPLRAVVRFHWTYADSSIRQHLTVYADSPRIDFRTEVDWHEKRQLLKVAFPVDIRATEATYDIQFGNVRRPTHWNTSWDYARFETVGHQWADLSEHGYGVSLLNDCKYGYDIKDNVMRLSLIKSATVPDAQADQGRHAFTYSLLPHRGDWREAEVVREAWALNSPLFALAGAPERSGLSMLRLDAGFVMINAVKKAEYADEAVIRLHEYKGARGTVALASDLAIASWQETDLLERPTGPLSTENVIRLDFKPYEIKTVKVAFGGCTRTDGRERRR